jgi:hypothetical protein
MCACVAPGPVRDRGLLDAAAGSGRHILIAEYAPKNRLVELSARGEIIWQHAFPSSAVMFRALPDGHVVYAYGGKPTGVQEIDRDHKVVWNYVSSAEQVLGFDSLPDGHVLLGEQGPPRAVEVDRDGKVVQVVPLQTSERGAHRQVRSLHKLANGNILVCHEGEAVVREYHPSGEIVWEYPGVPNVFEALRLGNGNTLISTASRLIEVNHEGKVEWSLDHNDVPTLALTWLTSIERLANGNLLIADFKRNAQGKGAHAFEITRDKKIVWTYADHDLVKVLTYVHALPAEARATSAIKL